MLRVCFCGIFFGIRFWQFSFQFWDISRHFLSRLPLFLKVYNGLEAQSGGFPAVLVPILVDFFIFKSHFSWNLGFLVSCKLFWKFFDPWKKYQILVGGGDIFPIFRGGAFSSLVLKIKWSSINHIYLESQCKIEDYLRFYKSKT